LKERRGLTPSFPTLKKGLTLFGGGKVCPPGKKGRWAPSTFFFLPEKRGKKILFCRGEKKRKKRHLKTESVLLLWNLKEKGKGGKRKGSLI